MKHLFYKYSILIIAMLTNISCGSLRKPILSDCPHVYVQYELRDAVIIIERNILLKKMDSVNPADKQRLKDLLYVKTRINELSLFNDSLIINEELKHTATQEDVVIWVEVSDMMVDLLQSKEVFVFDKRKKVYDNKYYCKKEYGDFSAYFEDGKCFFKQAVEIIE